MRVSATNNSVKYPFLMGFWNILYSNTCWKWPFSARSALVSHSFEASSSVRCCLIKRLLSTKPSQGKGVLVNLPWLGAIIDKDRTYDRGTVRAARGRPGVSLFSKGKLHMAARAHVRRYSFVNFLRYLPLLSNL